MTRQERAEAKRKRRAERTRPRPTKYALWNVTKAGEARRKRWNARRA